MTKKKKKKEEEEEESEESFRIVFARSARIGISTTQNLLDYGRGNQREFVSKARRKPSVASDLSGERSFADSKAAT